jgi:hypothetical protein
MNRIVELVPSNYFVWMAKNVPGIVDLLWNLPIFSF